MLISGSVALLDPHNVLPGLEWRTRDRLKTLAGRFESATGLHLQTRRLGGRRTCAEQDALYAQGRETSADIVTYASGCRSWHVLGRAADLDPITSGGVMQSSAAYKRAGQIWEALGGKWGGNFAGFADIGHFEYHPNLSIDQACPSPSFCKAIEASIQTSPPTWLFITLGATTAVVGFLGWQAWQQRRALLSYATR